MTLQGGKKRKEKIGCGKVQQLLLTISRRRRGKGHFQREGRGVGREGKEPWLSNVNYLSLLKKKRRREKGKKGSIYQLISYLQGKKKERVRA